MTPLPPVLALALWLTACAPPTPGRARLYHAARQAENAALLYMERSVEWMAVDARVSDSLAHLAYRYKRRRDSLLTLYKMTSQ